MKPLRIALTKGRLERDTVAALERIGLDCTQVREKGRRLILPVLTFPVRLFTSKLGIIKLYKRS